MKKINKDETPLFWSTYCRRNRNVHYKTADSEIKQELKQHMLEIQKHICAYCCSQIDDTKAHNEHIKPQDLYPNLSMEYTNLVVSCTTQGAESTCGMHKENDFNENLFVSPLSEDCENNFRFEMNGKVAGITEKGRYTVELLNLNSYRLVSARKALIDEIERSTTLGREYILQYYVNEKDGMLPRFVDMTEYFMKQGIFD